MKPPRRLPARPSFLSGLDDDESAAVMLFIQCCRQSPALRRWLWRDFVRIPAVRASFAKVLRRDTPAASQGPHTLTDLTGEARAWREERQHLKTELPQFARPYGGRTWNDMERLVRRYQAGTLDLGTFLLAHAWRNASPGQPSPALLGAAAKFLDAVMHDGEQKLLTHFLKSLRFLKRTEEAGSRKAALGYSTRWKLALLFHMLRHPRASYRTRDLRAHLVGHGFEINPKEIRRFCSAHGIRRDMRAGRPRKPRLSLAAG